MAAGATGTAAAKALRRIGRVWPAKSIPDGVQSFKKHILLYPEDGDMSKYDPWLLGAEDWIQKPGGFEAHPHRGFETITVIISGALRHTDESAGREGKIAIVREGDVQWMTAGRGVVHSEMPEGDGVAHVLQIWLNLPRTLKLMPSGHQDLLSASMPTVTEDGVTVRVVAGEHKGTKGAAKTQIPVTVLDTRLSNGASTDIAVPATHRGFVYVLSGALRLSGTEVAHTHVAWLNDGEDAKADGSLHLEATADDTRAVVFFGQPLREPVAARGPFVMSTPDELRQAYIDYQSGRF